jgi:putative ABC transport system ATP-binding protein
MPAPPAAGLVVDRVTKAFDGRRLLDAASMQVAAGESAALLGESGAGKSTLLNLIAGLEPVDAGRILIDGIDICALSPAEASRLRRDRIGFVFQSFHLLPYLNAERNVAVPLLLAGQRPAAALAAARALLDRLGLAGRRQALPGELSGGEQQRVALARALVHGPSLVLADEPTGNLDPGSAAGTLALIVDEVRASGATLLMVTHSGQAAAIASRHWRLAGGRLQAE